MKSQILFSRKSKKNITNLSSAESAHCMVSLKTPYCSAGWLRISAGNILKYFSCFFLEQWP